VARLVFLAQGDHAALDAAIDACLARTERTLYTRWRAISFLVRIRYEDQPTLPAAGHCQRRPLQPRQGSGPGELPRPEGRGPTRLKRRRVVEVAAAFGLPLVAGAALAVAALGGALDLGRGPLQAGPDLIGLQLGDRPLVALGGFPAALAQPAGNHHPVAPGKRVGPGLLQPVGQIGTARSWTACRGCATGLFDELVEEPERLSPSRGNRRRSVHIRVTTMKW
jgi:hypothetical protein